MRCSETRLTSNLGGIHAPWRSCKRVGGGVCADRRVQGPTVGKAHDMHTHSIRQRQQKQAATRALRHKPEGDSAHMTCKQQHGCSERHAACKTQEAQQQAKDAAHDANTSTVSPTSRPPRARHGYSGQCYPSALLPLPCGMLPHMTAGWRGIDHTVTHKTCTQFLCRRAHPQCCAQCCTHHRPVAGSQSCGCGRSPPTIGPHSPRDSVVLSPSCWLNAG
jgi:hypothetical protein